MRTLSKVTLLILLLWTLGANAQQLPQFTQYTYNTMSIKPAYAGSRDALGLVALHRSQWNGFDGGPKTLTLSMNTPLRNEKIGIGFSFIRDQLGYERFNYLYGDFSYTVHTVIHTQLSFSLKSV